MGVEEEKGVEEEEEDEVKEKEQEEGLGRRKTMRWSRWGGKKAKHKVTPLSCYSRTEPEERRRLTKAGGG